MKIGIFGGSFDPVHIEHIRVAQAAIQTLGLDRLLIMPAFAPPHKKGRLLTDNEARLEMCRLAFSGVEKAEVCDFEITQGGVSYTYLTCRHFKETYNGAELFWLVGTDMLRDFPTWKNPDDILSCATLAVCARNEKIDWVEREQKLFFERFGKNFVCVGYNGADVSSTKIRVLAAAGEDFSAFVSPAVYEYIQKRRLYEIPRAKDALVLEKPSRKAHSLRVAEVAAARATELKLDEKKVIAAALFHDCAKNLPPDHTLLQGFTPPDDWGEVPESVLHQFSGAYVAERAFGVTDLEILDAVRYHTSGKPQMTELGKLIFLADMVEEERRYDGVEKIRSAFYNQSLDEALALALQETVKFLQKKGAEIYPLTLSALEYYEKKGENIMTKTIDSKALALTVCKALADKLGKDIVSLYVREKTDICDYFIIASGSNAPQIRAMGERVEEFVEKEFGIVPTRTEGVRDGRWAVIDYADVIVHIFNDETRLFYHLERLWTDGGNLEKYNDKTETFEKA